MRTIEYKSAEWDAAWKALGNATRSQSDTNTLSGEVWQYMGTVPHKLFGEVHEFRHRDRPFAAPGIRASSLHTTDQRAPCDYRAAGRTIVLVHAVDLVPLSVSTT